MRPSAAKTPSAIPIPPGWILPSRHALGAALLGAGRYQEAGQVYREDLKRLPGNGWSLFGLYRALHLRGKRDESRPILARWEEVWKEYDTTLDVVMPLPAGPLINGKL